MSEYEGNPGDGHIWRGGTFPPEAECGYVAPLVDITENQRTGTEEDGTPIFEDVVVGQQVEHAEPTGVDCDLCRDELLAPEEPGE